MVMIAPSILSADFMRLGEEIRDAEDAGADLLHIDVMDGRFVPNITIGQDVVKGMREVTELPLDVHLMIDDPDKYIADFAVSGADIITVHYEATTHLHRTVQFIKEWGKKPGVSINPATPVCCLEDILSEVYLVLVMSVNPGFGSQSFIPESIEKIKRLRRAVDERGLGLFIEVDGGIKLENAKKVVDAGADILVMGSGFFHNDNYRKFLKKLRESIGA